jgi:serine protease
MSAAMGRLSLRELVNFLWKVFGFIGAVLSLRRWWRTLTNQDEPRKTRLLAGAVLVLLAVLLAASLSLRGRQAAVAAAPLTAADQIVVEARSARDVAEITARGRAHGARFVANCPEAVGEPVLTADVRGLDAEARIQLLADLRHDADVAAADFNDTYGVDGWRLPLPPISAEDIDRLTGPVRSTGPGMVPNDPRYGEQWNFELIGMPQAWEKATGKGAVVAVIDTGCAFQKEKDIPVASDLKDAKFTKPYDFVTKRAKAYDDHGHGTHVAGTIAQVTNNGHGVAGIAYDCTIMPLKVLSAQGSGTVADIADAIVYAADKGANIINMSLGGPRGNDVLRRACTYAHQKGVTIVCAAGNSGRQGVGYPAAYPECIAVSSVGPDGNLAFYSSWGPQIAVAAPGGCYRGEAERPNGILQNTVFAKKDVFEFWQGTSMASPHVAGVAALIYQCGVKTPEAIRDRLKSSAVKKDDPLKYGAGVLNAAAAVGADSTAVPASVDGGFVATAAAPKVAAGHRAPLSLGLALLALLGAAVARRARLRFGQQPAFWLAGLAAVVGLTCCATGFAGRLVVTTAGTAVWPLVVIAALFGARRLRPALAGLAVGHAAGAAAAGLLGLGAEGWLLANAAVALGLALLVNKPD